MGSASTVLRRHPMALVALAGAIIVVLTAVGVMATAQDTDERSGAFVARFGTGEINVAVQPAGVGSNDIHVYVTDAAGQLRDVDRPRMSVASDDGQQVADLSRVGIGHLIAPQQHLPAEGTYDLTLSAAVDGVVHQATGSIAVGTRDPGLARRVAQWCSLQLSRVQR